MASGSFSNKKGGYSIITEWTSTTNTLENTSTVVCTHKFKCSSGWALYVGSRKVTCTVGSDTKSFNTSKLSSDGGTTVTIGETTHIVPHNADGTMSVSASTTCKLQADIGSNGSTTWYEEVKATTTMTLDDIPRASTLTAYDGVLGVTQTVNINKEVNEFVHTIDWACGTMSGNVVTKTDAYWADWKPPYELASQNTTGSSVSVTYTITTYLNDELIGTSTTSAVYTIPDEVAPKVELSVSDAMGYEQPYGGYIQGLSKFKIDVTATPMFDSPIASYVTTANGTTYNSASFVTDAIKNSGESVISTTVTDQRRHSRNRYTTKNVLPYSKPTLKLSVARCDQNGVEDNQGDYMRIKYSCSITPLNNKNTLTSVIKYKQSSSNTYNSMIDTYANLFDINNHIELVDLYHNFENGAVYEAAGYYSFRIPVKPNTTYVTSSNVGVSEYNNLVFYDGSMNYLGGSPYNTADKVFTTPANTYFITLAVPTTYSWFQLEEGNIVHPYIAFGTTPISYTDRVVVIPADAGSSYDIELDISDNFSIVTKKTSVSTAFTFHHYKGPNVEGEGKNLFKPTLTNNGSGINSANAITELNNDVFKLTATGWDMYFGEVTNPGETYSEHKGVLIDVSKLSHVTFSLSNSQFNNNYLTRYDANKKSLGFLHYGAHKGTYTVETNAKYISFRFGLGGANGQSYSTTVQIESGDVATDYEPYIPAFAASMGLGKLAELEGGLDIGFKTRVEHGFVAPVLKPETDLNNVIEPNFYAGADANANKYANCPVSYGTFHLEVISAGADGQLLQRIKECTKDIHTPEYTRYSYGDGYWGAWMKTFDRSDLKSALLDLVYPINSIYISVNGTYPGDLFGGTWEQIQDTFLLAAGSTYGAGTTGGEAEHVLTVAELPKHGHPQNYAGGNSGSINRAVTTNTTGGSMLGDAIHGKSHGSKMAAQYAYVQPENPALIIGTGRIGNDVAHNNMPPYLAVYVWKRIS